MKTLVNISERASLAFHSLVIVAKISPKRISVVKLAEQLGVSKNHLSKVFQNLSKANLVNSVRGPAGGFQLNKKPKNITFLEIYEIIEGKVILPKCPLGQTECNFKMCIFDSKLNKISEEIYKILEETKLSSFT